MLRNKMSGFTLIELMVVIVIIGVLASLAIPRFTEASAKAKVAEAPRVLASYESAFLAAVTELPPDQIDGIKGGTDGDLVFDKPNDSKWFAYDDAVALTCKATAKGDMGAFKSAATLSTTYKKAAGTNKDYFEHAASLKLVAKKMVPNFCSQADGAGTITSDCK
jgi:prepilin-type N-terminal cleavage/methylation domain-containing protein